MPPRPQTTVKTAPPKPGKTREANRPRRLESWRTHSPERSDWCRMVDERIAEIGITKVEAAMRVGVSPTAFHDYVAGRVRPPMRDVELWARVLEITDETEVKKFHELALLGNAPTAVADLFTRQKAELARLARLNRELIAENLRLRDLLPPQ